MKRYFLELITNNLVIVDSNTGNAEIVPEIKNVRVFRAGGEAFMTQGHEDTAGHSSVREGGSNKSGGKRKCSKCGEPGHIARHCPN
jgi:Zinc knuckle